MVTLLKSLLPRTFSFIGRRIDSRPLFKIGQWVASRRSSQARGSLLAGHLI
jgi:hypothetical protein